MGLELGATNPPPDYDFSWLPMVSIVVPVYNEKDKIANTLQSLLNQSLLNQFLSKFEIIVVDNGSTDNTIDIAAQFPVRVLVSPRGKLTARRKGIYFSHGEIIVACDGDTFYPVYWLVYLLRHFYDPSVVAVSGEYWYVDQSLYNVALVPQNTGILQSIGYHRKHRMLGANSAFRRWAYDQTGGWRDVDQFKMKSISTEEEGNFGDRLATVGKYVLDLEAVCYTSSRRVNDQQHAQQRARGERF